MPVVGIFLLHNFAACVHCPPCPLNFKHIENMLCDVLGRQSPGCGKYQIRMLLLNISTFYE